MDLVISPHGIEAFAPASRRKGFGEPTWGYFADTDGLMSSTHPGIFLVVLGMGYWVNTVVGAEVGSSEITPLVHKLYSQKAKGFVSENQEMIDAVRKVCRATDGRGIFVFDRGGDRKELFDELLRDVGQRFIVRQRGDRHLLYCGKAIENLSLANNCKTPYGETVLKEEDGKEKP
jgi:hypothetical protein